MAGTPLSRPAGPAVVVRHQRSDLPRQHGQPAVRGHIAGAQPPTPAEVQSPDFRWRPSNWRTRLKAVGHQRPLPALTRSHAPSPAVGRGGASGRESGTSRIVGELPGSVPSCWKQIASLVSGSATMAENLSAKDAGAPRRRWAQRRGMTLMDRAAAVLLAPNRPRQAVRPN